MLLSMTLSLRKRELKSPRRKANVLSGLLPVWGRVIESKSMANPTHLTHKLNAGMSYRLLAIPHHPRSLLRLLRTEMTGKKSYPGN
jgi:hypothetical protein